MGVAHHDAYLVWFEMGRTELLRRKGVSYRQLEAAGEFLAIIELAVRYRRPARYDDLLELRTLVHRVTPVKVEHRYELLRDGELLTTASTTLACIGADGRPRRMPEVIAPA